MAISLSKSGSGRGRQRFGGPAEAMGEINIIPLVDVVLVLLIIFMLTAHVMEFGLEVDVPTVRITSSSPEELPVVTMNKKAEVFLNGKPVRLRELNSRIQAQFKDAKAVYVMADGAALWNQLAQVVAELSDAKLAIRLVTKPDESGGK
jgi:biopolymer transport protein ExbD